MTSSRVCECGRGAAWNEVVPSPGRGLLGDWPWMWTCKACGRWYWAAFNSLGGDDGLDLSAPTPEEVVQMAAEGIKA